MGQNAVRVGQGTSNAAHGGRRRREGRKRLPSELTVSASSSRSLLARAPRESATAHLSPSAVVLRATSRPAPRLPTDLSVCPQAPLYVYPPSLPPSSLSLSV